MPSLCSTFHLSICLCLLLIVRQASSFQGLSYNSNNNNNCNLRLSRRQGYPTSLSSSSDDIFANETPEEREERMKLVRQIQGAFYQPTATATTGDDDTEAEDESLTVPSENGILRNVPLFRVQWTELPGYQNILNIHVPHYTHMFRKIMAGPKPWRFGHLFLEGGSENLTNPQYALKEGTDATLVGTLMQISDVFEQEDGRLAMIVQGVERIRVVDSIQTEPYAMANVQLLPDEEVARSLLSLNKKEESPYAKCTNDLDEWNQWEILPTTWDNPKENGLRHITPLTNYNSQYFPDEISLTSSAEQDQNDGSSMEQVERQVWIALDEMIRLMQAAVSGNVPIPSQLLGLLPICNDEWPQEFQLDSYASQLEAKNAQIGTYTKTPFVRVSLCESYPSRRRANRTSYVIWILLNTLLQKVGVNGYPTPQELLELTSTKERLELACTHLESINTVLRRV